MPCEASAAEIKTGRQQQQARPGKCIRSLGARSARAGTRPPDVSPCPETGLFQVSRFTKASPARRRTARPPKGTCQFCKSGPGSVCQPVPFLRLQWAIGPCAIFAAACDRLGRPLPRLLDRNMAEVLEASAVMALMPPIKPSSRSSGADTRARRPPNWNLAMLSFILRSSWGRTRRAGGPLESRRGLVRRVVSGSRNSRTLPRTVFNVRPVQPTRYGVAAHGRWGVLLFPKRHWGWRC